MYFIFCILGANIILKLLPIENMNSKICELLDIEFPLVAFTHCRDVVVAVSKAGGCGVLGAVGMTPAQLEEELK